MRDPLENKLPPLQASYDVSLFTNEVEMKRRSDTMFAISDVFERIWESARLLALTIDASEGYTGDAAPFGRGWSRARMWEQYSESHRGVCLVFARDELAEHIEKSLVALALPQPYHREVDYTEQGPAGAIPRLDLEEFVETARAGGDVVEEAAVARFVEDHHDPLFFLKTLDWATEYEYRFVVTAPHQEYVHVGFADALKAVVVGERFPPWQRPGAIAACKQAGAMPFHLGWSSRRPLPEPLE
jgi:hypothetical protein